MNLRTSIEERYKEAVKSKNFEKANTLRLIKSAIKDKDIENRTNESNNEINDNQIMALLQNLIKQRKDSIESFKTASRDDLIVKEQFEIQNPSQVIEYLGMMGDSVDNIPGLPGVGDKTAKKFIKEYGSMENLLSNTGDLKGKLKEKIEANKELGKISKELAKIILDVPVNFDPDKFKMVNPNLEEIEKIFKELEFRRLLESLKKIFSKKINPESIDVPNEKGKIPGRQFNLFNQPGLGVNLDEKNHDFSNNNNFYQYINNPLGYELLINELLEQKTVSFDTKTDSIRALEAKLVGIAFSWLKNKGYYLIIPDNKSEANKVLK